MNRDIFARRVPTWFLVALLGAWVLLAHALGFHAAETGAPAQAWFGFLITIASFIWGGIQAAGHITLVVLQSSVIALWSFARGVYNATRDLGIDLLRGFRKAWDFTRALYDDILKPAWSKVWALVDRVRDTLERLFKPVLQFLRHVRAELLKFYDHWIRPVLDTIDVARKWLRVLSALHLDFAKTLDAKLAGIEDRIDGAFRFALGKVNEVINLVNRVVTADGLFQRLALVRSIERDMRYVAQAWWSAQGRRLSDDEKARRTAAEELPTVEDDSDEVNVLLRFNDGPLAPVVDEDVADFRIWARSNRRAA